MYFGVAERCPICDEGARAPHSARLTIFGQPGRFGFDDGVFEPEDLHAVMVT